MPMSPPTLRHQESSACHARARGPVLPAANVKEVSPDRFRAITESALEGLAKKELNLSTIVGKSAEAKERRLVPEVIEQFFVGAAPESGLRAKPTTPASHVYRVGKVPRNLIPIGDLQE